MFDYKYEMHTHSIGCSACSGSSCEELVRLAKEKGYTGIFLTNHFYYGNTAIDRSLPWADFVEKYNKDYLIAKKVGEEIGVDVFFGVEEGIGKGKEVLIYGISPEVLAAENGFTRFSLKEMSDFVHKNGGLIASAHPFRSREYVQDPDEAPDASLIDAVEVYNQGNNPASEDNEKAFNFANLNNLISISGGDVHNAKTMGKAGLAFPFRLKGFEDFKAALISKNYKLIVDGELQNP